MGKPLLSIARSPSGSRSYGGGSDRMRGRDTRSCFKALPAQTCAIAGLRMYGAPEGVYDGQGRLGTLGRVVGADRAVASEAEPSEQDPSPAAAPVGQSPGGAACANGWDSVQGSATAKRARRLQRMPMPPDSGCGALESRVPQRGPWRIHPEPRGDDFSSRRPKLNGTTCGFHHAAVPCQAWISAIRIFFILRSASTARAQGRDTLKPRAQVVDVDERAPFQVLAPEVPQ